MKVVLWQPQIPQNTGNVMRTCAVTGTELFLVPPLGFHLTDRWMRRAGLDYWEEVSLEIIPEFEKWLVSQNAPFFFFSSRATTSYEQVVYPENSLLIFGSETSGLPDFLWEKWSTHFVKLPMIPRPQARCLNLATSVGIALYEALRQNSFAGLRASLH